MTNNKRSVSSSFWLQKRCRDKYFQQAQKQGLRSRSWFKLAEIQQSDKPFRPGITVVDLGAAPGGWSQYVTTQIGCNGRVIACDIIPMDPIVGVEFLMGDIRDPRLLQEIIERIGKQKVQVLLSDMAPNMSGMSAIDVPKSMHLVELALDMCRDVLTPGGSFLVKVFHGDGFDEYLQLIRSRFKQAKIRKPNASRARSREVYVIATGYKL